MKIAIDVRKLRDYGIGTHISNVVLHAIRQEPAHEYFLFAHPSDVRADQPNIHWAPEESSKYSVKEHFALARRASKLGADLFHAPHYTLPLAVKCKSIVTIHDLIHIKFREMFPAWKVKAAEFVLKKAVAKADLVLTVSKTSEQDILELLPGARGKTEVLYNRLTTEWLEPPAMQSLDAFGIEPDFLLYVGNFKKHKGVHLLIDAYSKLNHPPPLVLAGKTTEIDSDLNDRILSLPRVRLLGYADFPLLHRLYSSAMIFVFPSLYEGFGYPPLEAMLCGTPVLSSDTPALREVLSDGVEFFQSGSAESLMEKLNELIVDTQRRSSLSKAGKERAMRFCTEESPRRLLEIYRRFAH